MRGQYKRPIDKLEWLHKKYLLTPCILYKGKLDCSKMEQAKIEYLQFKKELSK